MPQNSINCEQEHCNKRNLNLDPRDYQYYCWKCDKELCCVCSIISLLMTSYMVVFYKLIDDDDGGSLINF